MEFNEKLQELRKSKQLTQEELSQALFVSRTAISKWESGRGYPNIESLKNIAKFFSITVDELLSGEEVLTIAEEDAKQKITNLSDLVFGLLDLSVGLFFFLPFFGHSLDEVIYEVSLLSLKVETPYLLTVYMTVVVGIIACGILTLALQNFQFVFWNRVKSAVSLVLNIIGVFIFIIGSQPYAAIFLFMFLIIKVFMLVNKR